MRTSTITALVAALGLAVAAAPAAARPVAYQGKTKGGYSVTFKRSGARISGITTGVPTVCLATNRYGRSESGVELFQPPGAFTLGRTAKVSAYQKPVMYYSKVTKNYTVTVKRGARGRISGRLKVVFSFIVPTFPMPSMIIYGCVGSTTFTAKPR